MVDTFAGLEHHRVIVQQLPLQESYEIGSQVTFECTAPRSLKNFVNILPQFYYQWFSTVRGGNFYSSTGSATATITIPTHHPSSANYYCQIYRYRNGQLLGTGKTTLKVRGIYI